MRPSRLFTSIALGSSLVIFAAAAAFGQQPDRSTVLKGRPAPPMAAPEPAPEPARAIEVAAGEDLWLIDPAVGELVACRLLNTSTVGKRVIRCFEERLPARLRDKH